MAQGLGSGRRAGLSRAFSPERGASAILPRFVARGDFTDLMGRAAYGRPGMHLGVTV
jgi:hypothetical protein